MFHRFSLTLLISFLITIPAYASDLVRCRDASGVTVFRNAPCENGENLEHIYRELDWNDEIPFENSNRAGQYWIKGKLNGNQPIQFLIDTGANVVLVPKDIFDKLKEAGTVTQSDLKGFGYATVADGSRSRRQIFTLRTLQVGKHTLKNIRAIVGNPGVPALLGTSVLERLGNWRIDHRNRRLVLKNRPDPSGTMRQMARVSYLANDLPDKRKKSVKTALDVSDHLLMGQVLEESGQHEQAALAYREALRNNPLSDTAALRLAQLLIRYGEPATDLQEALQWVQRFENDTNPARLDILGQVYFHMGWMNRAVTVLEKAVAHGTGIGVIHYHLAQAYLKKGFKEKGHTQLELSLSGGGIFIERAHAEALYEKLGGPTLIKNASIAFP
ncbi:MAG: retroviral-like aspartic protease family protein [Magnetococcales bacterium]|nr:retroviral-like aspartic protease family protein [Magnetococcales bacterium]